MIIVDLKNEKNIETALKTFKSKVQKTKLIQSLRERQQYVKPSVVKRGKKLKAEYVEKFKNGLN